MRTPQTQAWAQDALRRLLAQMGTHVGDVTIVGGSSSPIPPASSQSPVKMTRLRGLANPLQRRRGGTIAAIVRCTPGKKCAVPATTKRRASTRRRANWMPGNVTLLIGPLCSQ